MNYSFPIAKGNERDSGCPVRWKIVVRLLSVHTHFSLILDLA